MADQIATRYGALGRELSHAALETIVLTARDGVNALDEVRRRLYCASPGLFSDQERTDQRWQELLGNLFPTATILVDSQASPSVALLDVSSTSDDERKISKLLTAVAAFLLAESGTLEEELSLWGAYTGAPDGEFDDLQAVLGRASTVSYVLLRHAKAGTWRRLLEAHAAVRVPGADWSTAERPPPRGTEGHDERAPTSVPVNLLAARQGGRDRLSVAGGRPGGRVEEGHGRPGGIVLPRRRVMRLTVNDDHHGGEIAPHPSRPSCTLTLAGLPGHQPWSPCQTSAAESRLLGMEPHDGTLQLSATLAAAITDWGRTLRAAALVLVVVVIGATSTVMALTWVNFR